MKFISIALVLIVSMASGCAHKKTDSVSVEEAARLNRNLVKDAVVFEPGSEQGAIVPDVSSPRLRAVWVDEHRENNKLIEGHRQWILEGDIVLLGIPKSAVPTATPSRGGAAREN